MSISLDDINNEESIIIKWEKTWNRAVIKRASFGFIAKNTDSLINMLNFSIVEIYPSGLKMGTKPLLVTSNEKLFNLIMMSKNKFDKAKESQISRNINGDYVNPRTNGDNPKDPKWIKTKNLVTGDYVFINTKSHTLTGRGIVIPHPMINETIDDNYIKIFEMIISNIRDKK